MIVTRPRSEGVLATATCTAAEGIGDLVYISGPKIGADFNVRKIDITDYTKMPAIALILQKISPTRAIIQFAGEITFFGGLTPGRVYYASDSGTATDVLPTVTLGQRKYWQRVGIAVDTGRIRLEFLKDLKTRVG